MKLSDNNKNGAWYSFTRENARIITALFRKGYAIHDHTHIGKSIVSLSDSLLCDFTSYRMGQGIEYEPTIIACPDPPLLIQPSEIYHKHVGIIPNYLGHIPGAIFRCGKTFGADTIDAKKWLQGNSALNRLGNNIV